MNNTLEGISSNISNVEKWKSNLEVVITAAEQKIEKRMKKIKTA